MSVKLEFLRKKLSSISEKLGSETKKLDNGPSVLENDPRKPSLQLTKVTTKTNNLNVNTFVKTFLVAVFGIIAAASCFDSKPARYSIQSSKTYEASMFRQNCAVCHGPEGEGKTLDDGRIIPNIRDGQHKYTTRDQIYDHITNGGNGMVPFRDILTEKERNSLVDFVLRDLRSAKP